MATQDTDVTDKVYKAIATGPSSIFVTAGRLGIIWRVGSSLPAVSEKGHPLMENQSLTITLEDSSEILYAKAHPGANTEVIYT